MRKKSPESCAGVRIYPLYNSSMLDDCEFSIERYSSDVFDASDAQEPDKLAGRR